MASYATVIDIAESLHCTIGTEDNAREVGLDAESFVRSLVGLADRIRRHKGRKQLRMTDINDGLKASDQEPLRGYRRCGATEMVNIGEVDGMEVLTMSDRQIPISDFRKLPLKSYPTDASFEFHWLAVNGVQPLIEQNMCEKAATCYIPDTKLHGMPGQVHFGDQAVMMISSKTRLTEQLQGYYLKALGVIRAHVQQEKATSDWPNVVKQLSSDAAFQPLVPFLVDYIQELIRTNTSQRVLTIALTLARAIFTNQNLEREAHLFSFLVIAGTLSMSDHIGGDDNHDGMCSLRDAASDFMSLIVDSYKDKYPDLEERLAEYVLSVLTQRPLYDSTTAPLQNSYGAVMNMMMINSRYVRELLMTQIETLVQTAKQELKDDDLYDVNKRMKRANYMGGLRRICGTCLNIDTARCNVSQETRDLYSGVVREFGCEFLSYCARS